jgi:cholesterol oxidase
VYNRANGMSTHHDWIIIGSGFGGSVSALRLAEKGYSVLVIEKGKRFGLSDFPKTNWDLKRWMWAPGAGLEGIFQMSFFEHVTILHGVGVGGGSLTYANTLPTPKSEFFNAPSWSGLADWEQELESHYATARRMLGSTLYPETTAPDRVLLDIAKDIGREDHFEKANVGVFFGEAGQQVADPYFDGKGPDRVGCTHCGACMTGCRVGAKNTLDRNYLYLAEALGCLVESETEVLAVRPRDGGGYRVETRGALRENKGHGEAFTADRVIFSGGVMGSLPLLLKMQEDPKGLPRLSPTLGYSVRTNSEALIGVIAPDAKEDFSEGVAITSILHTDEHSHIEPVRYGHGSSFFRTMTMPHAPGKTLLRRGMRAVGDIAKHPVRWAKAYTSNWDGKVPILLYMRTIEGSMRFKLGRGVTTGFKRGLVSEIAADAPKPEAFMEEATDLAWRVADKIGGVPSGILTEMLFGTPSTAHILGGCCMGKDADEGVINTDHEVFGYDGLYVIDGAAVSANPGVNPSLTITALAERAMSKIPAKA